MARPRKSYYLWIAGKALHALFMLGIFAMIFFLLWRVFFSGNIPREVEGLSPNATLAATYAERGDALLLQTQEQATVTKGESNYGYFGVPQFVFIPEAAQVQVLFRYNNSTLEATKQDFSLSEEPPRGTEVFDVSLLAVKDLTPEDKSDNADGSEALSQVRIKPSSHTVTTTWLYTYFLYTFDNVCVTDDTIAIFFDVYYKDAIDYEKPAYGTLRLYHAESPWLDVELRAADKRALEDYLK